MVGKSHEDNESIKMWVQGYIRTKHMAKLYMYIHKLHF